MLDDTAFTWFGFLQFFLTTSYVRKNIATTTKGADGKCPIGSKDIKENSELIFENNNTCLFTSRDAFFPVVPEDLVLVSDEVHHIDMSYRSLWHCMVFISVRPQLHIASFPVLVSDISWLS